MGTFSRALDTSSSVKLPSLHMAAAAASRDVTLFHAMSLLHNAKYDLGQVRTCIVVVLLYVSMHTPRSRSVFGEP